MYDPISRDIIRQALALSGIPKPLGSKRIAQQRLPSGAIVTAYRFTFDTAQVVERWDDPTIGNDERCAIFVYQLNGCFCPDIFPTDWDMSRGGQLLYITICTRKEATHVK